MTFFSEKVNFLQFYKHSHQLFPLRPCLWYQLGARLGPQLPFLTGSLKTRLPFLRDTQRLLEGSLHLELFVYLEGLVWFKRVTLC